MSDGNTVELSVRSGLKKIIEELEQLKTAAKNVSAELDKSGNEVGDSLNNQAKKTETFLGSLRSASRRVADQMRGDFKSLISLNAIQEAFKLSNQFKGSISEAVNLSDTIRKLGRTFGISSGEFVKFQSTMVRGLGELGLSSDVAAKIMEGLADTPVRGQKSLLEYSKTAGQLASLSKQQGREGDIGKGIANTITARGGNANDINQMQKVAEDLRRVFNQTGKGPAETVKAMEDMYTGMSADFRSSISSRGLTNLAAAGQVAGPNSTKFLEEYLGKSPIARQAFEAQGGKGIVGDNGIDLKKFAEFSKNILGRVGGDPRMAAQTLGLSEEAAEGFIRLSRSLEQVKAAQDGIANSTGDINQQYKESMGLSESFKANINKVKALLATPLAYLTQKGSSLLSGASGSTGGALGVVAGGGVLAALLAGIGTRGLSKMLSGGIGGIAKGAAASALTGKDVQPVYVTNISEMAGMAAAGGGGMGMLGKAAGVIGAGAVGYEIGSKVINPLLDKVQGTNDNGFQGNPMERFFAKLDEWTSGTLSGTPHGQYEKQNKVLIELNTRDLKASKQPTRGASY